LAGVYDSQGRYGEAEPLYREALQTSREVLGNRHPQTLTILNNLAGVYDSQGRYSEAEPLYQEALEGRRDVQRLSFCP
jgi:tetratricopeptide (TPR) repeat protein